METITGRQPDESSGASLVDLAEILARYHKERPLVEIRPHLEPAPVFEVALALPSAGRRRQRRRRSSIWWPRCTQ
jgi:hypothetical protein